MKDREYYYIGDGASRVRDWYKYPEFMGIREFYGGDLQGVLDKMDYLEELGVDVIYFNPIFVSSTISMIFRITIRRPHLVRSSMTEENVWLLGIMTMRMLPSISAV